MDLYFLGTGAGVPSRERNVTSIALRMLSERGSIWLFDCGEATQQQILHAPIKLSKLENIFITHLHGDHVFGLPGLLATRSSQEDQHPVRIFGPKGIRTFVETVLSISGTRLRYSLDIVEVKDGLLFEDGRVSVQVAALEHGVPSYGYQMVEHDGPGTLDAERLQAEGVPPGPIFKKLKNGETVTLDDGRVICGRDYLGPKKPGKRVTILGDTRPCRTAVALANRADILVHEATFMNKDRRHAHRYFHSTTVQAAKNAQDAGVKALVLTHLSSRYRGEEKPFLQEARQIFPNTFLAKDFWTFDI